MSTAMSQPLSRFSSIVLTGAAWLELKSGLRALIKDRCERLVRMNPPPASFASITSMLLKAISALYVTACG